MNRKLKLLCPALLVLGSIGACSSNDHPNASSPLVPIAQSIDTAQTLALAEQSSETKEPFMVNGGLVTFNDTSETTAPIAVNGM